MPVYTSGDVTRMRNRIANDLCLETDPAVRGAAEFAIQALESLDTEIRAAELSSQIKRAQKEIEQATERLNAIKRGD